MKKNILNNLNNMNKDKYIKSWNGTLILNPEWVDAHYMDLPSEMEKYQKIIDYYDSFDIL